MGNLEKRVARIERAKANVDLKKMTDEELNAYIATLDVGAPTVIESLHSGNPDFVAAVVEHALRHTRPLPVVEIDPDWTVENDSP